MSFQKIVSRPEISALVLLMAIFVVNGRSTPINPTVGPLQSVLPVPNNPNFVFAKDGGIRYCGLEHSSVWVALPQNFTSEGGAEIRCDLNIENDYTSALNKQLFSKAWGKRGYLVGIYPNVPIRNSLFLILEVDPVQTKKICRTCFIGRFYDSKAKRWRDLPTTYNVSLARVLIQINKLPPKSDYPAFADRSLIALFIR